MRARSQSDIPTLHDNVGHTEEQHLHPFLPMPPSIFTVCFFEIDTNDYLNYLVE